MVETSIRAELQNCIRNAQGCMMKMGQTLDAQQLEEQREVLKRLCTETGVLLQEAQQRSERLL